MTRTWLEGLKSSCRVASVNVCGDHTVLQTIFILETCNSGTAGTSYSVISGGPWAPHWASATYCRFPQTYLILWGRSTKHLKHGNTFEPSVVFGPSSAPRVGRWWRLKDPGATLMKLGRPSVPLNWICWKGKKSTPKTTPPPHALPQSTYIRLEAGTYFFLESSAVKTLLCLWARLISLLL